MVVSKVVNADLQSASMKLVEEKAQQNAMLLAERRTVVHYPYPRMRAPSWSMNTLHREMIPRKNWDLFVPNCLA